MTPILERAAQKCIQNLIDLALGKRNQTYAVTLDKAAIKVAYGAANEGSDGKLSQFPGAMEERVILEALMPPTDYTFGRQVHHQQLSGRICDRRYPVVPDGNRHPHQRSSG
jgi:hypothetical protein